MAGYIGRGITISDYPADVYTGDGTTAVFTLGSIPGNLASILVLVDGVKQEANATIYDINGDQLTLTSALPAGSTMEVIYLSLGGAINYPAQDSVSALAIKTSSTGAIRTKLDVYNKSETDTQITNAVGAANNLADDTDVSITTPANNDFLVYSGGVWVNNDPVAVRTALSVETTTQLNTRLSDYYNKAATDANFNLKAPLASPALTGVPTVPTAVTTTNTTQIASTAFVQQEITLSGSSLAHTLIYR